MPRHYCIGSSLVCHQGGAVAQVRRRQPLLSSWTSSSGATFKGHFWETVALDWGLIGIGRPPSNFLGCVVCLVSLTW